MPIRPEMRERVRQDRQLSVQVLSLSIPEPDPVRPGAPLCAARGGRHREWWVSATGDLGCCYCHPPAPGAAVQFMRDEEEEPSQ